MTVPRTTIILTRHRQTEMTSPARPHGRILRAEVPVA